MVDLQNPTNQFHSYQPPDATPHTDRDTSRWAMMKRGLGGINTSNLRGSVDKVRGYARQNPGKFLGGMAALIIGAGLMGARSSRRHRTPERM